MRILVTGGNGDLGLALVPLLVEAGHEVRVGGRRPRFRRDGATGVQLDLASGTGLAEAVTGVEAVVHLATDPFHLEQVDVAGTARLAEAARAAGVSHLLYLSIVGVDDHPFPYYRAKVDAERIVERSGIGWTILRATQFHSLVGRYVEPLLALPILPVPRRVRLQPVDGRVVADRLVELIAAGPSGRVPDLGGPRVERLESLVRRYVRARGLRRLVVPVPFGGKTIAAFRDGRLLTEQRAAGAQTFDDYATTLRPVRRDAAFRLLRLTAVLFGVPALLLAFAPGFFHAEIAPFGPRSDHFLRDLATFVVPVAIALWMAASRPSWRRPVLVLASIQNGLHVLNHAVDVLATDPAWLGPANLAALVVVQVLLWRALRLSSRAAFDQPVPEAVPA